MILLDLMIYILNLILIYKDLKLYFENSRYLLIYIFNLF